MKSKPFIKFAGGKQKLLTDIRSNMPEEYNRYFEPFIGGGALFFNLAPKIAFINDYNKELSDLYKIVRDRPQELMDAIMHHENTKDHYYAIRAVDRSAGYEDMSDVSKAARFVFLNKTGYNGLYRVNKMGQNNVPFGNYAKPTMFDKENILACSKALEGVEIGNYDFSEILDKTERGDFVYMDPPYHPLTSTSSFTEYTSGGFSSEDQTRLRYFCDSLNEKGVHFMLSNSSTDLIKGLYTDYNIKTIRAARTINSKGNSRGKIDELLITNY